VEVRSDSQLVVNQMAGRWAVRAKHLKDYVAEAKDAASYFDTVTYAWIPRHRNAMADKITREILDQEV